VAFNYFLLDLESSAPKMVHFSAEQEIDDPLHVWLPYWIPGNFGGQFGKCYFVQLRSQFCCF